ncbi:Heat shock protein 70 (Hsp 70) family protein isoform 1 [Hibiscus syriacus]|uniref:Heat shock protein 70 (Hsp 70) family protein isoform 1 n=1 Tax=Hibiscus syriacus TaxID=106335 RepID=A0A6A2YHY7_HIBSY|nr:Heat shock protein 70 (Hsp 70) family protein isoform 1 [Hibiscus syriacus]
MEEGTGINTVLQNLGDKSKVLDVKPLRTLVPQFPAVSNGPPFVCAPPNGPLPSGFSHFFPFSRPQGSHSMPGLNRNEFYPVVLIRSFRAEPPASNGQTVHEHNEMTGTENWLKMCFGGLMLRRKLSQMEDNFEPYSGIIKRSVLKAGNIMMSKGYMAGIDPMPMKGDLEGERVAVSIVSSGGYDDDVEDPDVLVYTGHGGNASGDNEASNQKLVRGNLALERSLYRANEVRVIRVFQDTSYQTSKVYVYDGLYKIQQSWMEKEKSGCNMFKDGLILPDLTSGAESIHVSLVNEVDDEKGPAHFTYLSTIKYLKSFKLGQHSFGCDCREACLAGNSNCCCIKKNRGLHKLASRFTLKFLRRKIGGWGLRSWDPIRAGTFICEYAGEVIDETNTRQDGRDCESNEYVFQTNRVYESFKWNYETELVGEESSDTAEDYDISSPLTISSKNSGNVARHILPMTELTYDYGIPHSNESESNGADYGKKKCSCGSPKCQGYFC